MTNGIRVLFSTAIFSALSIPAFANAEVGSFDDTIAFDTADTYTEVLVTDGNQEVSEYGQPIEENIVYEASGEEVIAGWSEEGQAEFSMDAFGEQFAAQLIPQIQELPSTNPIELSPEPVDSPEEQPTESEYHISTPIGTDACDSLPACAKGKEIGKILAEEYLDDPKTRFSLLTCTATERNVSCQKIAARRVNGSTLNDTESIIKQITRGCELGIAETCTAQLHKVR